MNLQLAQLRSLISERFPAAMHTHFSQPKGAEEKSVRLWPGKLVEVVSPNLAAGAGLLLLQLAAQAKGSLAWIDAADSLDLASLPRGLGNRLLWLRGHGVKDSLKAADMLLRDGNLQTVFLDLRLVSEKQLASLPSSIWHRLRMLSEKTHAAAGIFTPSATVACAAARWSVNGRFDLASLHQEHGVLVNELQILAQRGQGIMPADDCDGVPLQS